MGNAASAGAFDTPDAALLQELHQPQLFAWSTVEGSLRKSVSKNEFASWMRTLTAVDFAGPPDVTSGEGLLELLQREYAASKRVRQAATASGLAPVESLAVLLFTSEALLTRNVNAMLLTIDHDAKGRALQQRIAAAAAAAESHHRGSSFVGRLRQLSNASSALSTARPTRLDYLQLIADDAVLLALKKRLQEEMSYFTTPLMAGLRLLPAHAQGMAFRLCIRRTARKPRPGTDAAEVLRRRQQGQGPGLWHRALKAISTALSDPEFDEYLLNCVDDGEDDVTGTTARQAQARPADGDDPTNDVTGTIAFVGFTSCASRFLTLHQQDLLRKALTDKALAGRVAVLCMRVNTARRIGPLSCFPKSNEVALLPGWRGRTVREPLLAHSWKAVLCSMWQLEADVVHDLDVICVEETSPVPFPKEASLIGPSREEQQQRAAVAVAAAASVSSSSASSARSTAAAARASARAQRRARNDPATRAKAAAAKPTEKTFVDVLAEALVGEYAAIVERDTENVPAMRHLAFLQQHTLRAHDEMKTLRKILRLEPKDYDANVRLGFLLDHEIHDYKASIAQYELGLAHHDGTPDVHCTVGQLMETHRIGDVMFRAKRHYELGLRLNGAHADSHAHLGHLLKVRGDLGDLELARKHFEAALAVDKTHPKACYQLATMLLAGETGSDHLVHERCLGLLAAAVEREPTNADAHYYHALMLMQQYTWQVRHHLLLKHYEFPEYIAPDLLLTSDGPSTTNGDGAPDTRDDAAAESSRRRATDGHDEAPPVAAAIAIAPPSEDSASQGPAADTTAAAAGSSKTPLAAAAASNHLPPVAALRAAQDLHDALEACLAHNPQHPYAGGLLGGLLVASFRDDRAAMPLLKAARKRNRADGRVLHALGVVALREAALSDLQDYDDAREYWEASLAAEPMRADTMCCLGRLLEDRFDNRPGAKRLYKRALQAAPQFPLALTCIGWLAERFGGGGCTDGGGGGSSKARALYEQALSHAPQHAYSMYRLGHLLSTDQAAAPAASGALGSRHKRARALLEASIRLDPADPRSYHSLARLLERHFRDYDTALAAYRDALVLDPFSGDCHNEVGYLLLARYHKPLEAKAHFVRAVQLVPGHSDAHSNLGLVLRRFGDGTRDTLEAARGEFEAAIAADPSNAGAQCHLAALVAELNRGETYLAGGRDEGAKMQFLQALRLNPDDFLTHVAYGQLLETGFRDYPGARVHYAKVLELQPLYGPAHCYFGRMILNDPSTAQYEGLSGYEEGLQYLQNAANLMPLDAESHNLLGRLLEEKLQRFDEAKTQFELAVRLKPDFAEAHFNLGQHLARHSDRAQGTTTDRGPTLSYSQRHHYADDADEVVCVDVAMKDADSLTLAPSPRHGSTTRRRSTTENTYASSFLLDDAEFAEDASHAVRCSAKSLARRHLLTALELSPGNPTYHLALARLLMTSRFNELDAAVEHVETLLEAYPKHAEALFMLGCIEEISKKRMDKAYACYCRALEAGEFAVRQTTQPPQQPQQQQQQQPSGGSSGGEEAFRQQLSKLRVDAHFALAQLMKKHLGDLHGAVAHFEAVLRLDPGHRAAADSLERLRKSGLRPDCMANAEYAEYLLATFGAARQPTAHAAADAVDSTQAPAGPSSRAATPAAAARPSSHAASGDGAYPAWY